ncbi:TetR/AcrR family transcriptional regulator [Arthrobacter cavernae]|uniref:TetR/AcrR family transcriptional regulator n=1 Tax=Arthrobacter cavernae TaxID=2817681 RepID=A0A939HII0_9MICC|nr:TetR/AcrR family transcriptional regulator [Arthrobacter cavernae]MBO1267923.1 TetR/AcrR family transcriptional regulator [Arthrobacter cavernae]
MPKIVDHDERRLELVDATWRIIARLGIEGATMREIALEAGFANGALKPYFPTKDTLLTFAFRHVFNRTNERIREVTAGKAGITALRAFCVEVLPLDSERVNEARIVVPFWQKAINDPEKAAIHRESMDQWRGAIQGYLTEARRQGDVNAAVDDSVVSGHLLNMLLGAQIAAALAPGIETDLGLGDQLEAFLTLLQAGS